MDHRTEPSKCGNEAVRYLRTLDHLEGPLDVLDIGCGNGRDLFHLSKHFRINALGIDIDEDALHHARKAKAVAGSEQDRVGFRCCKISELDDKGYDVIISSSMCHFLRKNERKEMIAFIKKILRPRGALILTTLSVNDKNYYGKGKPVPDEPHSFIQNVYLHFTTEEEMRQDFAFIDLEELYEYEEIYIHEDEDRCDSWLSWVLIGQRIGDGETFRF